MTKFVSIVLTLLLLAPAIAGKTKPKAGQYVFTKAFSLKVATEYSGGRGVAVHPEKFATKNFKPGDKIKVDEFYWISENNAWEAKYVYKGVNRSIPMDRLKLSP